MCYRMLSHLARVGLNILDKTSDFLRSRSLASLTWAGLIRLSEDEGQRHPNDSYPCTLHGQVGGRSWTQVLTNYCFGSFLSQMSAPHLPDLSHGG